ncbi:MAG: substrate-binding domain-containing protein [Ruminococcus sp.]|nr:substrate-binding domain-containing protein [Ruminococcus sp.]
MALQKRIGIIVGRIYKNINKELLEGILEQMYSKGFSAYIFTLNEECTNQKITLGELNLFHAIRFSLLDGILYAPYTFASTQYYEYIEQFLLEHCPIPVIRIGIEKKNFIPVWYEDRAEIAEITSHLICEHQCRKIYFLTGPEHLEISQNRQLGFRDAMEKAGLPCSEEDIIYGDFWFFAAQRLAEEIAGGIRPRPDAVVCANDTMAISLCDALKEHGISVPEDICVTGYDGYTESRIHVPAITTYKTSWRQLGRVSMCRLYSEITGDEMQLCGSEKGVLYPRESCGCDSKREYFDRHEFDYLQFAERFMDYSLSAALHDAESLNGFIDRMFSMTYTFINEERYRDEHFYLCLCEDWDRTETEDGERFYRTEGYSEQLLFISVEHDRVMFPAAEMLPAFLDTSEPKVTCFTAVHFQERCFGYACFEITGSIEDFSMDYLRFCREVNNGLESLCAQNELKRLAYRKYISESRDELTGLYLLEGCSRIWKETAEAAKLYGKDIYLTVLSIGGLRRLEDTSGPVEKERLLVAFSDMLSKSCRNKENIFRVGETGFAVIGAERPPWTQHKAFIERAEEQFRQYNLTMDVPCYLYIKQDTAIVSGTDICDSVKATEMIEKMLSSHASSGEPSLSEQLHYTELVKIRKEIYLFPEREWGIEACSRRLNISESYFHKLYRRIFGVNCMSDVHRSRMNLAKKLLVTTNETLQSIAAKCGYDYAHFMRAFKKDTGVTPTQYRRGKQS